jgi:uncharacterized protein
MILRDKDRETLTKIFETISLPVEVLAYGSRVNGTAHEGSDLDLVIRAHDLKPLPAIVFGGLCEKIRDSNIPILVELRDWVRLPENFHQQIEKNYEVLFDNWSTHSS